MSPKSTSARNGDAGSPGRGWLRRRPVYLFVIVTFLVSYGLGVPALMMAGSAAPGLNEVAQLYLGRFFVVVGPTCGAIAAVFVTSGVGAIVSFVRRQLRLARGMRLPAISIPFVGLALVAAAYAGAGTPVRAIASGLGEAWPLLLIHMLLQILVVGVGEELGWRGWMLPRLAGAYGLGRATLVTGTVWYVWHLPILLGGIGDALGFALAITGLSMLFSVLWLRSGQAAIVPAIAHGSVNAPVVFFTAVLRDADHQLAWNLLCIMLFACGLAALLLARSHFRFGQKAM